MFGYLGYRIQIMVGGYWERYDDNVYSTIASAGKARFAAIAELPDFEFRVF